MREFVVSEIADCAAFVEERLEDASAASTALQQHQHQQEASSSTGVHLLPHHAVLARPSVLGRSCAPRVHRATLTPYPRANPMIHPSPAIELSPLSLPSLPDEPVVAV